METVIMATRKPAVRKLTVYSPIRAELLAFEKEYNSIVVECDTPKGMTAAKASRKEIRDVRSNLEDLRKETKAPYLAKGAQVDEEAKAIKGVLDILFNKFDTAIKAIENKAEIDKQKALDAALAKVKDLEDREAAIIAKEIELGLREADPEEVDEPTAFTATDNIDTGVDDTPDRPVVEEKMDSTVICQPHIDAANDRLAALKAIRKLIEPTDPQKPDSIDEGIARQHDEVLAEVWDIVDSITCE
jgi:hypothetical protein